MYICVCVCGLKSRCLHCVDASPKFWTCYMKFYYIIDATYYLKNATKQHLAVQTAHDGMRLDHRKRKSGTDVYMVRVESQDVRTSPRRRPHPSVRVPRRQVA